MKKEKLLDKLKWKWFMFKINLGLIRSEDADKWIRNNLCAYGYHKLERSERTLTGSKIRKIHVEYLRCKFCNYHFFSTMKDKEKYLKITDPKQNPLVTFPSDTIFTNTIKTEGSGGNKK